MLQVFLDTETTGLENGACVVEIAAIMVEDGVIVDTFHRYCKPYRSISPGAFEAHGLTLEFLSNKPEEKEVLKEFIGWMRSTSTEPVDEVLAYNAKFDVRIINDRCMMDNLVMTRFFDEYRVVDVAQMAKQALKSGKLGVGLTARRWNQVYVASLMGLDYEAHSALEDVKAMKKIYDELVLRGVRSDC